MTEPRNAKRDPGAVPLAADKSMRTLSLRPSKRTVPLIVRSVMPRFCAVIWPLRTAMTPLSDLCVGDNEYSRFAVRRPDPLCSDGESVSRSARSALSARIEP